MCQLSADQIKHILISTI